MGTVISVEGISKSYQLGQIGTGTLARDLGVWWAKVRGKPNPMLKLGQVERIGGDGEILWALKDVSFVVPQGEVLGIIGLNGAGKSTLLKVLSRVTAPTRGEIKVRGRIASLLEVGTGFNPELTGRENIYLNGAILGMRRAEVKRKFEEIVEFSEVEQFIDTPVKRYSSGMYVRLAFAVAAHLEPEILLVDEVLAVGDAEFQKKCLGKMGDVAKQGRTILFVSHNMASVSNLCPRTLLLRNGTIERLGESNSVIEYYQKTTNFQDKLATDLSRYRAKWASPYIKSVRLLDENFEERYSFPLGSTIVVEMTFDTNGLHELVNPVIGVVVNSPLKGTIGSVNTRMTGYTISTGKCLGGTVRCILEKMPLLQGQYTIDFWLGEMYSDVDMLSDALSFSIEPSDIYKTGKPPAASRGIMFYNPIWQVVDLK
jgi:lipopolysaccharide transport system ATP-binding protein